MVTSHEDALELILNNICVLGTEEKPLLDCLGQTAAEDVCSAYDLPMLDLAGPDGYAVCSSDIGTATRDTPVVLSIVGTIRAGQLPESPVVSGTTVRIMTGSPMPAGADCVVRFEDTDEPGDKNGPNPEGPSQVKIFVKGSAGSNVRRAGGNVVKGELVLPKGTVVGPAQVSALASIGKASLRVVRRPTVVIISTGDELISLDEPLLPGKAYDCNSVALTALVSHLGGIACVSGVASDDEASLTAKMLDGLATADAIITSGGVSKGDYDLVRLVTGRLGEVLLSRINTGPGASFAFGLLRRAPDGTDSETVPVFGLSGPPVGCLNNFEMLARPALSKMMGREASYATFEAVACDEVSGKRPMAFVHWTRLQTSNGTRLVNIRPPVGFGALANMVTADSLLVVPEGREVARGDLVQVHRLDWVHG